MCVQLITDYLESVVKKYPNKIAFSDCQHEITFSELQKKSKAIASFLAKNAVFKKPVVVFLEKSIESIVSFIGIAYSGNFYTPIDVDMPKKRIEKITQVLDPVVVITDREHYEYAMIFFNNMEVVLVEDLLDMNVCDELIEDCLKRLVDTDLLYVLFTSGSTGTPKGVAINHRSVIDYIDWFADTFDISKSNTIGNQAMFHFDLSLQDIYLPMKTGATTILIDSTRFMFPVEVIKLLVKKNIDTIVWIPSILTMIVNMKALDIVNLPNLKNVMFCGEVMPNKQLNKWRMKYPKTKFVNLYGPTEVTEVCTFFCINRSFTDDESLPIGIPCKNSSVLVLNDNNELVHGDEVGELCVRGTSLSPGYYNDIEKTRQVFVQNPLNKRYPEIIYRTGDLVRYNELGELMYISRKDFQIKHMGHRIELGEIEAALSSLDGVDMSCCIYDTQASKIVAIYTGKSQKKDIRDSMKKLLPEYMLPKKYINLPEMPLNINGKIDRSYLKTII